ncbi:MAG: CoA pyrophosphatase [Rhodanobacteraceae bacterium]
MTVSLADAISKSQLRRAVRALDDAPCAPGWNADELADLVDPHRPRQSAAVLVPLICRRAGISILFTVRSERMRQHAGQVSFPGGRIEIDDSDAIAAALRETREETGIEPTSIEAFGYLDSFETVSGYCVVPVTGFVEGNYRARPDGVEVAELFEVPLAFVLAPGRLRSRRVRWRGRLRDIVEFDWEGHRVWGATAAMLLNLARRVRTCTT